MTAAAATVATPVAATATAIAAATTTVAATVVALVATGFAAGAEVAQLTGKLGVELVVEADGDGATLGRGRAATLVVAATR